MIKIMTIEDFADFVSLKIKANDKIHYGICLVKEYIENYESYYEFNMPDCNIFYSQELVDNCGREYDTFYIVSITRDGYTPTIIMNYPEIDDKSIKIPLLMDLQKAITYCKYVIFEDC